MTYMKKRTQSIRLTTAVPAQTTSEIRPPIRLPAGLGCEISKWSVVKPMRRSEDSVMLVQL
jgi:hypothetical protein